MAAQGRRAASRSAARPKAAHEQHRAGPDVVHRLSLQRMKPEQQCGRQGRAGMSEPLQDQAEEEQHDRQMKQDAHQVKGPGPGAGRQVVQMERPERQWPAAVLFQERPVVEALGHQRAFQDQRVVVEVEGRRKGVEIDRAGDHHEGRRCKSRTALRIHVTHFMARHFVCAASCQKGDPSCPPFHPRPATDVRKAPAPPTLDWEFPNLTRIGGFAIVNPPRRPAILGRIHPGVNRRVRENARMAALRSIGTDSGDPA